ncbi:MAG: alpha/beta fold hydrolase [Solirubrobacteraceae bacterium]
MTVVFIAPIGSDARSWDRVPVAHAGVRHELPGFGRPRATVPPTMASLADELVAEHPGPLHLVGISMGGMVAQHAALRHPDRVASLLVACTGAATDPATMEARAQAAEEGGMEAVIDGTLERWFTPEALLRDPPHPGVDYARQTLQALDPRAFADGWRAIGGHDVRARLPELAMPLTAVAGSADAASPLRRSEELADRAPNGRLAVVDGAPHMIHLECPDRFSSVVAEHLRWARAELGAAR